MPASMTAFAARDTTLDAGVLSWELRSVNHRYLEIQARLPEALRALEPEVRERISAVLGRGRVECILRFTPTDAEHSLELDEARVRAIVEACHQIDDHLINPARLSSLDILAWPGVARQPEPDLASLRDPALDLLDAVLDDLAAQRAREGERLAEYIRERCRRIADLVAAEREQAAQVTTRLRSRLTERLKQLDVDYDPGRLEQELVYHAQRLDISEELDRLDSHLAAIEQALTADEPIGRRLDFLMQELNREANTLGSKAADSDHAQVSVELKVAIEQMREQVQNLE